MPSGYDGATESGSVLGASGCWADLFDLVTWDPEEPAVLHTRVTRGELQAVKLIAIHSGLTMQAVCRAMIQAAMRGVESGSIATSTSECWHG